MSGAADYSFTTVDGPVTPYSTHLDVITDSDLTLGTAYYTLVIHGFYNYIPVNFLYENGSASTVTDANSGNGVLQGGAGINDEGSIVGDGFVVIGGVFSSFPDVLHNQQYGINDVGQIVGDDQSYQGGVSYLLSGGKVAEVANQLPSYAGHITETTSINNAGQIVGTYQGVPNSDTSFDFVETAGKIQIIKNPFPVGISFSIVGMNDSGEILGNWTDPDSEKHSFIEQNGVASELDVPGAVQTIATSINDEGDIVGSYVDASGVTHGFEANPTNVPPVTTLTGLLILAGQTESASYALTATGSLAGFGIITHAVLPNNGTIESHGGKLVLAGVAGTGALVSDAGSDLVLTAAAEATSVTVAGTVELTGSPFNSPSTTITATGHLVGLGPVMEKVVSQGTVEAKGGLMILAGGVTGHGAIVVDTAAETKLSAASSAASLHDAGTVDLIGYSLTTSSVGIAAGGRLVGNGQVFGAIHNDGSIDAKGGRLFLANTVSGTGALGIEAGATLDLGSAAASAVDFHGALAGLTVENFSAFGGVLVGMSASDWLSLPNETILSARFDASASKLDVILSGGGRALSIESPGSSTFAISDHGHTLTMV